MFLPALRNTGLGARNIYLNVVLGRAHSCIDRHGTYIYTSDILTPLPRHVCLNHLPHIWMAVAVLPDYERISSAPLVWFLGQ